MCVRQVAPEKPHIAGVTSGLLEMGREVTWRGKHFGVWQESHQQNYPVLSTRLLP